MNKIDILLDIVEFKVINENDEKACIVLECLNSGFQKFNISHKQYTNLKNKINLFINNVFICFNNYNFIWADSDNIDFLKNIFKGEVVFSNEQLLENHPVTLSCNDILEQNEINTQNKYTKPKEYDIGNIVSDEELLKELELHFATNLFNVSSNGLVDIENVQLFQKNESYDFQNQVSKLAVINNQYGMFMEAGTGKSKTSIDAACTLLKNGEITKCLIIPPANLINNWKEEIEKHCDSDLISKILVFSNKNLEKNERNKKEILELKNLIKSTKNNAEIILLKDKIKELQPITEQYISEIKSGKILLIIDESHNIKNPLAQKTKYLFSILSENSRVFLLSATPFPKEFQDMFVTLKIFNIINKKTNWYQFKNFFYIEEKNGFGGVEKLILKPEKEYLSKLIISRLKNKASFVKKINVLNLPEQIYKVHYYEPSEEQSSLIQNILNDTPIPEHIKITSIPFSNKQLKDSIIRIMQIQGGFYLKDGKFYELEINNKFKLLLKLLTEYKNEKIIIFCAFTAEADLINSKLNDLGFKSICKHGKLKKKVSEEAINKFKNEDFDILVATGDSAGTGVTLIQGCTIIYYSNNFNSVTREQAEGRIHRVGQTRDCTYHDLLSYGGVDEIIFNCLKRKIINKDGMFKKLRQLKEK
ncbi:MAG: DEAD/DEAH box helicase [Campylobacterales bacterium]|nr:DEAD/DEAH box helicase [Campylobacterales bacterium]